MSYTPTEWKDHILSNNTYNLTKNEDGTYNISPAGTVVQQGTKMSAENFNKLESGVYENSKEIENLKEKAAVPMITVSEQFTLTADSWTDNSQTVNVSVNTENRNIIDPVPESLEEWCRCGVYASVESADGVTFVCSEVPETDLNFQITSMVVSTNAG